MFINTGFRIDVSYNEATDVLTMFAAFAVLALYSFGKAIYDTGRRDGTKLAIEHIRLIELSVKPNNHNHSNNYLPLLNPK